MPEDIGMTLIFLIALMVMAIMLVFIYINVHLNPFSSSGQIGYSIDFVKIANTPFMLAEVMAHAKPGDRQLLEQAIEIAAAGSPEAAGATKLPAELDSFLGTFGLREYHVSIQSDGRELARIESIESRCGDNLEGWCVFGECDAGRVEISSDRCASQWQKCCKEDKDEYINTVGRAKNINIVSCSDSRGVCSEGVRPSWLMSWFADTKPSCAQHRIYLGEPAECKPANSGQTPVCCAPKTEETLVEAGALSKAVVPLLYKGLVYGTLEVSAK